MGKWTRVFALAVTAMFLPSVCWAASPWTEKTTYTDKAIGKFEFGFKNLAGGWTEIITEPMERHEKEKTVSSVFVGVGEGLYEGVIFTVGGALHLATFPITQLDIPLLDNGVNFED